jgi:hypothetical protein
VAKHRADQEGAEQQRARAQELARYRPLARVHRDQRPRLEVRRRHGEILLVVRHLEEAALGLDLADRRRCQQVEAILELFGRRAPDRVPFALGDPVALQRGAPGRLEVRKGLVADHRRINERREAVRLAPGFGDRGEACSAQHAVADPAAELAGELLGKEPRLARDGAGPDFRHERQIGGGELVLRIGRVEQLQIIANDAGDGQAVEPPRRHAVADIGHRRDRRAAELRCARQAAVGREGERHAAIFRLPQRRYIRPTAAGRPCFGFVPCRGRAAARARTASGSPLIRSLA